MGWWPDLNVFLPIVLCTIVYTNRSFRIFRSKQRTFYAAPTDCNMKEHRKFSMSSLSRLILCHIPNFERKLLPGPASLIRAVGCSNKAIFGNCFLPSYQDLREKVARQAITVQNWKSQKLLSTKFSRFSSLQSSQYKIGMKYDKYVMISVSFDSNCRRYKCTARSSIV